MSNVIQIKHGPSAPANGILAPYELGYSDDEGTIYIGNSNNKTIPLNYIKANSEITQNLQLASGKSLKIGVVAEIASTGSHIVNIHQITNTATWSRGIHYRDSTGATVGAIGIHGSGETVEHMYVGTTYNTKDAWLLVNPQGTLTFNNFILGSDGYGTSLPSSGTEGQVFFLIED